MTFSPRMLAAIIFFMGLAVITYQVYELNQFRMGMKDVVINKLDIETDIKTGDASKQKSAALRLAELAPQSLMGQPYKPPVQPLANKPVVDTQLKLELVGTIRAAGKDSALIQSRGKETKRYFVGEQIEGGAILDSVSEDAVTLKRAGVIETLRYSKVVLPAIPDPIPEPANEQATQENQADQQDQTTDEDESVAEEPNTARLSLRERLKRKARRVQ